jgi:choline kinase
MIPERLKGIILCAGRGARLQPLTDDRPKCLLRFEGRAILDYCLDAFRSAGIDDVILVSGYRQDMIETFLAERGERKITLVRNDRYAETNTAYSLNLALRALETGFVLANGDVLFDPAILRDLVAHPSPNCLAVDADIPLDSEEVKVIVRDGQVVDIGKGLDPRLCSGEAIGLNKIASALLGDLRRIYDDFIRSGELQHFFEKGFQRICAEGGTGDRAFAVMPTERRPWVEIDTHEDFAYAQREVAPRLRR